MRSADNGNLRRLIWSAALALVIALLVPHHTHRRDFDRAFAAWLHDRSPENEAALHKQQETNRRIEGLVSSLRLYSLLCLWALRRSGLISGGTRIQTDPFPGKPVHWRILRV